MRNFRFRLDPVVRLKEYHIERTEEEIARIEGEIQRLLREIEEARAAVQDMRRRILEEVDDQHFIQAERELDLFSQFTTREEHRRFGEIAQWNREKDQRQQELVKLYQDKKVLERLKERRRTEWETEMRREEGAIMDEIGTQKYIRRQREFGGVILYLLVPIALVAAVAAVGIATGVIDQDMLNKLPFFGKSPKSATATIQSPTAALEEEFITLERLIGDPQTPMPILLKNFADRLEQLRQKEQRLKEWESQLQGKQVLFEQQQNMLAQLTRQASDYLGAYQDMKRQIEQSTKSELSKYEDELSTTLSSAKGKEIAQIMINLYEPTADRAEERRLLAEEQTLRNEETQLRLQEQQAMSAPEPDEIVLAGIGENLRLNQEKYSKNQGDLKRIQEKIRESQLLLLRILHRFQPRGRKDLFVALGKSNPDTASQIIADFASTTGAELNNIKPTPTPILSAEESEGGTAPPGAG